MEWKDKPNISSARAYWLITNSPGKKWTFNLYHVLQTTQNHPLWKVRGAAGWSSSDLPRWVSHLTWKRVLAGAEGGCPLSPSSLMSLPSVDDNYDRSFMSANACQESVENIHMCHMARWVLQAAPAGWRCTSGWRSMPAEPRPTPDTSWVQAPPHWLAPRCGGGRHPTAWHTRHLMPAERPCCLSGVTNMAVMLCSHPFVPQE